MTFFPSFSVRFRSMITAVIISIVIVILDQITKTWILEQDYTSPLPLLSFFDLVLVHNKGMSFGLFSQGFILSPVFFLILASLILLGLFVWLYQTPRLVLAFAIGGIAGGALGNGIDRIRFGAVIDFLDFHLGAWHWPAFNIADSAIVLGVAIILAESLFAPQLKA